MPRLDIYISNKGTSQEALEQTPANGGIAPQSKSNEKTQSVGSTILKSAIAHTLIQTGISTTKTMIQTQMSFYGDMTGDYIKQRRMENNYNAFMESSSMAIGVATSFAINPVMGAVTLGVTALNLGIKQWQEDKRERLEVNRANAIANFNSQRLGSKLVNGNR